MEYKINCTKCLNDLQFPDSMLGQTAECPHCSNNVLLAAPPAIPVDVPEQEFMPQTEPEPVYEVEVEQPAVPEELPERMKANKKTLGKTCGVCGNGVELGEDLYNCQKCYNTMHAACHENHKSCTTPGCENNTAAAAAAAAAAPAAGVASSGLARGGKKKLSMKKQGPGRVPNTHERVACRFCGEEIAKMAKKCRYCGEFQKESDRKLNQKLSKAANAEDDNLSGGEIALGILCSGIACILAIVYICQGKKKGVKLLIISIITQIVIGVIRALVENA